MRVLLLFGYVTALASSNPVSCRHSSYTDTTNPNRMKLGFYCVDTASWTTAANGDTANIDACTTWTEGGGGFYHSASTCQSLAVVDITGPTTSVQVISHSFAIPSALRLSFSVTTGSSVDGGMLCWARGQHVTAVYICI